MCADPQIIVDNNATAARLDAVELELKTLRETKQAEEAYHENMGITGELISALEHAILSQVFGQQHRRLGITIQDIVAPLNSTRAELRDRGWPTLKRDYLIDQRFGGAEVLGLPVLHEGAA